MRIAVSGASGFLGSALLPALRADGHTVVQLVRRPAADPSEISWDPGAGVLDPHVLRGVDAVINLSGANVAGTRWTPAYKQTLRDSRVRTTTLLSNAIAAMEVPPQVFLSGSAVGFYGDRGDAPLDESSTSGNSFLAGVCRDWEDATSSAERAGVRVVHLRTGVVLDRSGGALERMEPLLKLGIAGPLGSGRQYWAWITLADWLAAVRFLLRPDTVLAGPVNLTAPKPETNARITTALARHLSRPALLPVPAFALRLALGEFVAEFLASQRVFPRRLLDAGFTFASPDIDTAAPAVLH